MGSEVVVVGVVVVVSGRHVRANGDAFPGPLSTATLSQAAR